MSLTKICAPIDGSSIYKEVGLREGLGGEKAKIIFKKKLLTSLENMNK